MPRRRRPPSEAPIRRPSVEVHEILDRAIAGDTLDAAQLDAVAAAAAGFRRQWFQEVAEAISFLRAGTIEYEAFKRCLQSIGTLLVQHGFVGAAEMQEIWIRVEGVGS